MTESTEETSANEPAELVLVQVADDAALVFGSGAPKWLDVQPLVGVTSEERRRLLDAAAVSVGGLNALAQVGGAVAASQGLVQLTPATLTALQSLTPMVGASGNNLGMLVDAAGKIGHVVQWTPAGAASAASFAASMGTSVALIAIQVQLAQISKKVDANIALTKDVLAELKWQNEAELIALVANVRRAYNEAAAIGAVTRDVYAELQGKAYLLEKSRHVLQSRIAGYSEELEHARTKEARRKWLVEHAERCLTDLQSLVQVQQGWYVLLALRAESIAISDPSEHGQRLVAHIRDAAQSEHDTTAQQVIALADRLQRQLGLLAESNDRRLGRFKSARDARTRAELIRSAVLHSMPALEQGSSDDVVLIGDAEKLQRAVRMLPLITGRDDRLMCAASCTIDGSGRALLLIMEELIILSTERSVFDHHRFDHHIPTEAIRYFNSGTQGRLVEMATPERFFAWRWPLGDVGETVGWANQLLASFMHLPAGEIPERPQPLTSVPGPPVERGRV